MKERKKYKPRKKKIGGQRGNKNAAREDAFDDYLHLPVYNKDKRNWRREGRWIGHTTLAPFIREAINEYVKYLKRRRKKK